MVAVGNQIGREEKLFPWENSNSVEYVVKGKSSFSNKQPQKEEVSESRLPIECLSHDVKNMLNTILGYSQILKKVKSSLTEDEVTEYLDKIQKATLRASELIDKYRISYPKKNSEGQKVDINTAVREVTDYIRSSQYRHIEIKAVPLFKDVFVEGNTTLLVHALMNLALNACRAMKDGGSLTLISDIVESSPDGLTEDFVRIRMIDTGPGMGSKMVRKALLSGFTTKFGSGHGIGLHNVRKTILDQGGTLSVRSTVGCGTEFTILFPIKRSRGV